MDIIFSLFVGLGFRNDIWFTQPMPRITIYLILYQCLFLYLVHDFEWRKKINLTRTTPLYRYGETWHKTRAHQSIWKILTVCHWNCLFNRFVDPIPLDNSDTTQTLNQRMNRRGFRKCSVSQLECVENQLESKWIRDADVKYGKTLLPKC